MEHRKRRCKGKTPCACGACTAEGARFITLDAKDKPWHDSGRGTPISPRAVIAD